LLEVHTVRQDQVCGAATENARRVNSVGVLAQQTAERHRKIVRAELARSRRSGMLHLEHQRCHLVGDSLLHWQPVE